MLHCQLNGLLAMSNHPNRGGVKTPFSNPAPEAVLAARIAAGLTQAEAGRLVRSARRSWQEWESGGRVHGRIDRSEKRRIQRVRHKIVHGRIDRSENSRARVRSVRPVHGRIDRSENLR